MIGCHYCTYHGSRRDIGHKCPNCGEGDVTILPRRWTSPRREAERYDTLTQKKPNVRKMIQQGLQAVG